MAMQLSKPPVSFWVIGVVALIWNVLGIVNFIGQLDADFVAAMPESHRALIEGRAVWATSAFAIAVFGGALGCILMLFKSALSVPVFVISLLGVLVQLIPSIQVATTTHSFTVFEIALAFCGPVIMALFLIWYARRCHRDGILC